MSADLEDTRRRFNALMAIGKPKPRPPDIPIDAEGPTVGAVEPSGLELQSEIQVTPCPVSVKALPEQYVAHGWSLVPIPDGLKGPSGPGTTGWNKRKRCVLPSTWRGNVGLAHAYSGTCAIDIDDLEHAAAFLKGHAIDLDVLLKAPDAVLISSGRPNRAKLLYRLAEPLPSKKIIEKVDGLKQNIIDFRCATSNVEGSAK